MSAKSFTIGGILITALGTIVYASADLIAGSPEILFWIGFVILATLVSIFGSWGVAEYYKRISYAAFIQESINKKFHPKHSKDRDPYEQERRTIYRVETWSCFVMMILCGSIFMLLEGAGIRHALVISILWVVYSLMIGLLTDPLWRFSYDKIRPRVIKAPGSGSTDA